MLLGEPFDWDMFTKDLGESYQLLEPGFNIKRYPAYIYLQRPIEAVLDLRRKHDIRPDDVEYLELEIPRVRSDLSRPQPATGLEGKFSFEYCAAVALAEGRVVIESFSDSTRFSAPVEEALGKVRLQVNDSIPTDLLQTWAVARVKTKSGQGAHRDVSQLSRLYRQSYGPGGTTVVESQEVV